MRSITELAELKTIELDIMKKIHTFCIEHDIRYYLCFGTLIGAMRHEGFIPWDDDIDIWMKRADYEKFLDLFPKFQDNLGLSVVNHKTVPFFGRAMSKVIDNRTVLTEPGYRFDDPIGVFVDIWPLDALPNDTKERKRVIRKVRILDKKLYFCITKKLKFNSVKEIIKSIMILLHRGARPEKILDRIEKILLTSIEKVPHQVMSPAFPKNVYDASYFDNVALAKFEDAEFFIPVRFDEILTTIYGDWRKLPPVEQRVPQHVIDVYWK